MVHAVTVVRFGPLRPYRIETLPAASFAMSAVMKKGEMTRGPLWRYLFCVSSMMGRPPMPDPMTTAIRSRLSSRTGRPESSIANCAAAIA